jgi:SPOR domain
MTGLELTARCKTANVSAVTAVALAVALTIVPICVRAETKVRGTPQAVVVETQNASVEEVLVALSDIFKIRFQSATKLDKRLTGTYKGTLQHAVSRILHGYHFTMKSSPAGLEITLLGAGTSVGVAGAPGATRPADAAVARQPPTAAVESGDRLVPIAIQGLGARTPVSEPGPGQASMPTKPDDAPPRLPAMPTTSAGLPASPVPAPSPTRAVWVAQLIGEGSETVALSRFRRLQGKLHSALGNYQPAVLRTALKDGTTWIRVRVEFDTRQAAEALCSKLEAAHEPCVVQRN